MLYHVYIAGGIDLLFTNEKIIINCFTESTRDYDIFNSTAHAVAAHFGGEIQSLTLDEDKQDDVFEMLEDAETNGSEKDVVTLILNNSTPSTE
jgi:hypothetical protein